MNNKNSSYDDNDSHDGGVWPLVFSIREAGQPLLLTGPLFHLEQFWEWEENNIFFLNNSILVMTIDNDTDDEEFVQRLMTTKMMMLLIMIMMIGVMLMMMSLST